MPLSLYHCKDISIHIGRRANGATDDPAPDTAMVLSCSVPLPSEHYRAAAGNTFFRVPFPFSFSFILYAAATAAGLDVEEL